jgi:polyisoprenoid-binding protein YceI
MAVCIAVVHTTGDILMRGLIFIAALSAASAAYAEPVTYVLDPAHTQVAFSVDRFGYDRVLGRFDAVSGEVVLDEQSPANSSVHAVVQIASISTGNDLRNEHLRGARWLNAEQFPAMEFRSTSVRITGEHHAQVTGDLTLLGQTHPLTLEVTLNRVGPAPNNQRPTAGFSATGSLARAAWGSTIAPSLIGDAVSIQIEALAQAPAPAQNN